jgi:DNA-binding beta-propeller fold protein YncE
VRAPTTLRRNWRLLAWLAAWLLLAAGAPAAASGEAGYHLARVVALPGDEGWDYLSYEPQSQRVFIAHGTQVLVVDAHTLAVVGQVSDTPGVHGVAFAPQLGRGFASAGRADAVVVFDLRTLARQAQIPVTGANPDAILYEPQTQRVLTFNGRGRNATIIDAASLAVLGTIALDAKPEAAVADGTGNVFVNLEDRNSLARLDARSVRVTAVWPLPGCEEPSGLALDRAGQRLFAVCSNQQLVAVDARSGRLLGHGPIGRGPDAAAYDAAGGVAIASCGEGVLSMLQLTAAGTTLAQQVATQRGARTLAFDEADRRIFLVTADFAPPAPPSAQQPRPRPSPLPGTFRLLLVERTP